MDCSRSVLRLIACFLLRYELSHPSPFGWDATGIVADLLVLGVGAASISMIRRGSTEHRDSPPEARS